MFELTYANMLLGTCAIRKQHYRILVKLKLWHLSGRILARLRWDRWVKSDAVVAELKNPRREDKQGVCDWKSSVVHMEYMSCQNCQHQSVFFGPHVHVQKSRLLTKKFPVSFWLLMPAWWSMVITCLDVKCMPPKCHLLIFMTDLTENTRKRSQCHANNGWRESNWEI